MDPVDAMNRATMNGAACRADRFHGINQINIQMKAIFMIKHFDNLKIRQSKQFCDSIQLHRISPYKDGFCRKQNLTIFG